MKSLNLIFCQNKVAHFNNTSVAKIKHLRSKLNKTNQHNYRSLNIFFHKINKVRDTYKKELKQYFNIAFRLCLKGTWGQKLTPVFMA